MAHDPLANVGTRLGSTPQGQPAFGRSDQVQNTAGGFVFEINDRARVRRFLVLGTEGGTFYQREQALTLENARVVLKVATEDGLWLVDELVKVSTENLAPRVQPTLFALAIAASVDDDKVRSAALDALPAICRTGYHLMKFIGYVEQFRGWGRGLRRAVSNWYLNKDLDQVAYQIVKYGQREGWSNRDILRLAHPFPGDDAVNRMFKYIVGQDVRLDGLPRIIEGVVKVREAQSAKVVAKVVADYDLPREVVPSEFLATHEVWDAMLPRMPMTALIRNLGVMSANGALNALSDNERVVLSKLGNQEAILKAKVHPFAVLLALTTYQEGHGVKGSKSWTPVTSVVDALDEAFYMAFDNVVPSGKNTMIALDISGSMEWDTIMNTHITPRQASAAMSLITLNAEPRTMVTAFSSKGGWYSHDNDGIDVVNISPKMRLDTVVRKTGELPAGGTDCALPMIYAEKNKLEVDTFVIYTDNETWAGNVHPFQALRQYRQASGRPAKVVVVGMTSTGFSIADPTDPGMLDVVGFDASAPQVIADFGADRI